MPSYQLAEGHDNTAGFVEMRNVIAGGERLAYITSLGTYQAAREIVGLDGIVRDDGDDTFEWTFAWMSPEQLAYIQTNFLNGARSGPVTVETLTNAGDWVEVNAILTLPRTLSLNGEYFGPVIFTFTRAEAV